MFAVKWQFLLHSGTGKEWSCWLIVQEVSEVVWRLGSGPVAVWSQPRPQSLLPLNSLSFKTPRTSEDHLVLLFAPFVRRGPAFSEPSGRPMGLPIHWREKQEIAWRVDSPLWWANLVWPLAPSTASQVQITVLQSGGFVTVELRQRQSSWTWTSTTGGITVSSLRTCVRGGLMTFFADICLSLK